MRDSCSGLSITVNTVPLAQPGIEMRIESLGTGFSCCGCCAAALTDTLPPARRVYRVLACRQSTPIRGSAARLRDSVMVTYNDVMARTTRSSTARSSSAGAFADREQERARLGQDLAEGQKVFLISPRRYGKSSLVRDVHARPGRGSGSSPSR